MSLFYVNDDVPRQPSYNTELLITLQPNGAFSFLPFFLFFFLMMILMTIVNGKLSPLVGLVDTDGSLVLQVTHSADGSVPPKPLHLRPCCCRHCASEAWVGYQLVCVLDGLLIVPWGVQEACRHTCSWWTLFARDKHFLPSLGSKSPQQNALGA